MLNPRLPLPRSDWCLFLDFDGTLVEIAESPDAVRAGRHLAGILDAILLRLGGAVAIVSGRPIAEIDRHLDRPALPVAGLHGLEIRCPGRSVRRLKVAPPDAAVQAALRVFAAGHAGLLLESKGLAVALHYRARPDLAGACLAAARRAVAGHPGLEILRGKMVVEVKPVSGDKGQAVHCFMRVPPFAGRLPVFAGDDRTDEDGFRAASALGGFGVKIGEGESAALWRIGSVGEFLRWLAEMPKRLEQAAGKAVDP